MYHGTNHFVSISAAVNYYRDYTESNSIRNATIEVNHALMEGRIQIGPPTLKDNESLLINKTEGRYIIETIA